MYNFHNFSLTPEQDLVVNIAVFAVLIFAIIKGERKLPDNSPLVTLLLVTFLCIAGRVLLQPLPNVQPVTVTVILVGIYYGAPWAIALSGCVALSTNMLFLGHGPWTFFQFVGWSLVGVMGSAFSQRIQLDGKIAIGRLTALSVLSAFAFDWIVSASILLNHDYSTFLTYLANGLVFDLYHAIGNVVFVILLSTSLGDIMTRKNTIKRDRAVIRLVTS